MGKAIHPLNQLPGPKAHFLLGHSTYFSEDPLQFLKESMRLYPPVVLLARSASQAYDLKGYKIPQNCVMLISPWVMQRSDRYFTDPLAFKPERWQTDLEKQLPKGVYFPFGEGPRICIGKGFAQMEATLILATLAQHYQLRLSSGRAIEAVPSITLRPKGGMKMTLSRRFNRAA